MHEKQRVADMANGVLARQVRARAERTGAAFEDELKVALGTEAGWQLGELREGSHRDERADRWQEDLAPQRAKERNRVLLEERKRALQDAVWERFVQEELRDLELRKGGQLAVLLGEPLPGEPPEQLRRLASEDRRQAEDGLVALMSGGKVSYKRLDELSREDRPARIAAERLRTTWLKERPDVWLARREGSA